MEVLRPLIQNSIEELELQFSEVEYYAINVITVLNVLDYDKSDYIKFSDGNRIMVIEKYVFKKCDALVNHNIFKIVDEPGRKAFVSDSFKQTAEDNKLSGFKFELVWDSDYD